MVPGPAPAVRAKIGLWRVATAMKIGLQFENLLKRGLLNYAYRLPNGTPSSATSTTRPSKRDITG
nr:hypothetical protein GCM10020093_042380 [Planobispora longispora]